MSTSLKHQVLLIDDDADIHAIAKAFLDEDQFNVTSVFTVEEAMKFLSKAEFDVILLDMCLQPGKLDGEAFLARIKSMMEDNHIIPPVIVTTGLKDKEIVDYVMTIGATDFLNKPFTPISLSNMVEDYAW